MGDEVAQNPSLSTFVLVLLVVACGLSLPMSSAGGATCHEGGGAVMDTSAEGNAFLVDGEEAQATSDCPAGTSGMAAHSVSQVRDSDLDALCVREAIGAGRSPFRFCDLTPTDLPSITPGLVLRAFERILCRPVRW